MCFSVSLLFTCKNTESRAQIAFFNSPDIHSCTQNYLRKARGEAKQFLDKCKNSWYKSGGGEMKTIIMHSQYVVWETLIGSNFALSPNKANGSGGIISWSGKFIFFISLNLSKKGVSLLPIHTGCATSKCSAPEKAPVAAAVLDGGQSHN